LEVEYFNRRILLSAECHPRSVGRDNGTLCKTLDRKPADDRRVVILSDGKASE